MNANPTSFLRRVEEDSDLPVSARIRSRLIGAKQRYHANDNISAFVMDGEVDALGSEVEAKMAEVLKSLVIDTEGDHNTQETARRVAKMFLTEVFKGRYHAMPAVTEFPNIEQLNELLIVGPITARWAGDRDRGRPLLHALARRQGRRFPHDQQRDARLVSQGS